MKQFPVFFNLTKQPCLVVGDGEEAAAKVRLLCAARAQIDILADDPCTDLKTDLAEGRVQRTHQPEPWSSGRYRLVIVADATPEKAKSISRACIDRGIPVNVVDKPGLCSFTVPAIVDRDPVTIAISTGGASPIMARSIKGQIEALLPSALGALAALYASRRAKLKRLVKGTNRRAIWEAAHHGSVSKLAYSGDLPAATRALDELIENGPGEASRAAHITLLDLRHGDPDQVTLGELRRLQCANTVVFDENTPHALRELCRRDAARHTLLATDSGASVVAKQLSNLSAPGERLVLLATGAWFTDKARHALQTRLLAQGVLVDQTSPAVTTPTRCASAL